MYFNVMKTVKQISKTKAFLQLLPLTKEAIEINKVIKAICDHALKNKGLI